jgi:hypothetical protein
MSIAPVQRPGASRPDAAPVTSFECAPGGSRERSGGAIEFVLELGPASQLAERRIASVALHRFRRHGPTAVKFAGRCARNAGEGIEVARMMS